MRYSTTALCFAAALVTAGVQAQSRGETDVNAAEDTSVGEDAAHAAASDVIELDASGAPAQNDSDDAAAAAAIESDDPDPGAASAANASDDDAESSDDGVEREPLDVDPDAIETVVRASIDASTPVAEGQIDVKARKDGTVTLQGTVPSEAQKQLVETVAANSPGVRDVRSQLVIREPGQPPPRRPQ